MGASEEKMEERVVDDGKGGRLCVCVCMCACVLCGPNMNLTIVKIQSKLFLKVAKTILSKIVIITIKAIQYQI